MTDYSAASDVYKRKLLDAANAGIEKLNEIQASILDGVE